MWDSHFVYDYKFTYEELKGVSVCYIHKDIRFLSQDNFHILLPQLPINFSSTIDVRIEKTCMYMVPLNLMAC